MTEEDTPSFLKINNNKNEKENDDDYPDILSLRKRKNNKIEFEKFKPKNIINKNQEPSLKGAENKVKSILSSFLLTMESEEDKNSRRIKFLREKLSTKKAKFACNLEKNSKKNLGNLKPLNNFIHKKPEHYSNKNITSEILNNYLLTSDEEGITRKILVQEGKTQKKI